MENIELKYQQRIVVFLDVLGFKNKLSEFEHEALTNIENNSVNDFISQKANDFVGVFKDVIGLMDKFNCKYYLFSDNICITVDPFYNKSLAIEILFTVSSLFKRFTKMGYFLRGGIDYGWILDEEDIALGVPLANAYLMESTQAIYPRIIISQRFVEFLNESVLIEQDAFNKDNFLKTSCEINHINLFYNVIKTDDKIGFFSEYKDIIEKALLESEQKEFIHMKFKWRAIEYNNFLNEYTDNISNFEQESIIEEKVINKLKTLKIL